MGAFVLCGITMPVQSPFGELPSKAVACGRNRRTFGSFLIYYYTATWLALEVPMVPGEEILRHLIGEYGPALHLPTGDNLIAAHIAKEARLAKGTLLSVLNGSTARINESTRTKLATFFNRVAVPPIQPNWLSSNSLHEFNSKRASSGLIPLTVPTDHYQKVV